MEILIIGTSPPCPRCDKTFMMAEDIVADLGKGYSVRQIDLKSEEASAIAAADGRQIGTTNEVSEASGEQIDRKAFAAAVLKAAESTDENCRPAELWSPDFDKSLENVARAADRAGFYMTPVVVIDGKVLWHGSVPAEDDLRKWITACS